MEDKGLLRLIKKARLGNKEAFCKVIEAKGRKIVFVATNLMGNKVDGEDAAQEAVITLARKIGTLKKAELFDAWMYRIVFNVCMDEKRKKARKLDTSGEFDTALTTIAEHNPEIIPEQNLEDTASKEAIMAAINELPERYRLCLILYYYEDMSYNEIAQTLQVSEQVVANTLNRAREKLRISLSDEYAVSTDTAIEDEHSFKEAQLPLAVKAGTLLPALAISQAFAMSDALTVTSSAVAGLTGVAAATMMPKGLLLLRLVDSVVTKSLGGAACAAALVGALVLNLPAQNVPEPQPDPTPPAEEQAVVKEQAPPTAKVEGLPEGSKTTVLTEGVDTAALQEFKANITQYTDVASLDDAGYHYTVYRNNSDETDYVLTIEKIESQ